MFVTFYAFCDQEGKPSVDKPHDKPARAGGLASPQVIKRTEDEKKRT